MSNQGVNCQCQLAILRKKKSTLVSLQTDQNMTGRKKNSIATIKNIDHLQEILNLHSFDLQTTLPH